MHPKLRVKDSISEALVECVLYDYPTAARGFYCVYDINELDEDVKREDKCFPVIGLGDFFFFNLLLLFVIPENSSIVTRGCIAFVCIIIVQLGDLCTIYMLPYGDPKGVPAVPFPTVFVTAYAIALDAIGQYSDIDCESLSK